MASTRQATGNSKPRVIEKVDPVAAPKKKRAAPKKAAGTKTKANTSAPRSKKVSADKVTKKSAAPKKKASAAGTKKAPVKKTPAATKATTTAKKATTVIKKAATPKAATKAEPKHEPTVMDTVNGALLKVQGAILGRPGKKAAGTAKMRGTDNKKATK